MRFTVAIDGPAAAGKGTIARAVARELGFAHLDTGALYRAVALKSLDGEDPAQAAQDLDPASLADPRLRGAEVAREASRVAAIPEVRAALLQFQKDFARREGGAVLDGRDIGTVICPQAAVKIFVTASPAVRAARRTAELAGRGEPADPAAILADIERRDARDRARTVAPLVPAPDAHLLDTTDLDIDAAFRAAVDIVETVRAGRRRG